MSFLNAVRETLEKLSEKLGTNLTLGDITYWYDVKGFKDLVNKDGFRRLFPSQKETARLVKTTVEIVNENPQGVITFKGVARCHPNDAPTKIEGRATAFQHALTLAEVTILGPVTADTSKILQFPAVLN